MKKFLTVAVFQYPSEAYVIKSKLESENIQVFLRDELTVQTYHFVSNALGGIRLQVKEEDFEKARVILIKAGVIDPNQNEKSSSKTIALLDKLPFFKEQDSQIRLFFYSSLILVPLMLLFIYYLYPSAEEREAKEGFLLNQKLYTEVFPKVDSLLEANPKLAVAYLEQLTNLYPQNANLNNRLGFVYYKIDSFLKAINSFEKSIPNLRFSNYELPQVLANIAHCKTKLGNIDGAIESLTHAANLNSDFHKELGSAYEAKGDLKNAVKYYNKYIDEQRTLMLLNNKETDVYLLEKKKDSLVNLLVEDGK